MWKRGLHLDFMNPQNPIDFTVYTPFYMNLPLFELRTEFFSFGFCLFKFQITISSYGKQLSDS